VVTVDAVFGNAKLQYLAFETEFNVCPSAPDALPRADWPCGHSGRDLTENFPHLPRVELGQV
jgi:hypothetical protein